MQTEFLTRVSKPVQDFILEVEEGAGVGIQVILDPKQNEGGTTGQGKLAIVVNAQKIHLFAPTNGYFPDGAVRHEVLHVQRFHIEKVPKLVLADDAEWDKGLSDAMGELDNAIEHVAIVPKELQLHPERLEHWEKVMQHVTLDLANIPEYERELAISLHWTFLRHVLPESPSIETLRTFAKKHALLEKADQFFEQFISALPKKEDLVQFLFQSFPGIPRHRVALEYINSTTGTYQKPIP